MEQDKVSLSDFLLLTNNVSALAMLSKRVLLLTREIQEVRILAVSKICCRQHWIPPHCIEVADDNFVT
ncbi:hypothetical protein D3C76_1649130 [compost metagenome]